MVQKKTATGRMNSGPSQAFQQSFSTELAQAFLVQVQLLPLGF